MEEIESQQLMDCRSKDGGRTKIGAGLLKGGGLAVLQHASEVLLSQVECARYLALFRSVSGKATGRP